MGRISSEPQTDTTTHFSHPHPLKLTNYQPHHQTLTLACSGCKLKPSGMIYLCTTCPFFLHKKCFEMPKKITHPFHKDHALTLLTEPTYLSGHFSCDACKETGNGFSYHCKPCGIDLHVLCASMPLSVTHPSHEHKLSLTFQSPYGAIDFCCDICKRNGSASQWLYWCSSCGFDAHINCARTTLQNPMASQTPQAAMVPRLAPQPQPHAQGFGPQFVPVQQINPMPNPMIINNPAVGFPTTIPGQVMAPYAAGVNRQNEMLIQSIQQMIQNNNAMTQAILAGAGGGVGAGFGGVSGGNIGTQQIMQLISGTNSAGGGLGMNALQGLMGGNGLDFLGGGGFDLLGGGGFDFLGGLGGLF